MNAIDREAIQLIKGIFDFLKKDRTISKFEVDSVWETRCGSKAVISGRTDCRLFVDHECFGAGIHHYIDTGYYVGSPHDEGRHLGDSHMDLIKPWVEPRKIVRFLNIYPNQSLKGTFLCKEDADKYAASDRLDCIRIEWNEGGEHKTESV